MKNICIVDDDAAVLRSLRALLESVGLPVVSFESPEEFLSMATPAELSCIVLDIRMPGMSGVELQAVLSQRGWKLPVIFVTGHGDVRTAVRAVKAGAVDFIEKPYNDQELLDCIQKALSNDSARNDEVVESVTVAKRLQSLSVREREVLDLVVAGQSSKVIARELQISPKTVDFHRGRVIEKMHATSTLDLVRLVFASGKNNVTHPSLSTLVPRVSERN